MKRFIAAILAVLFAALIPGLTAAAAGDKTTEYTVKVKTAQGKSGNVFVSLVGENQTTTFTCVGQDMTSDADTEFSFSTDTIKKVIAVRVYHSTNIGSREWLPDSISVNGENFKFNVSDSERLLNSSTIGSVGGVLTSASSGSFKDSAEARGSESGGSVASASFNIELLTGMDEGCDTDAKVLLRVFGTKGYSSLMPLFYEGTDSFVRGQKDSFMIVDSDVGEILGVYLMLEGEDEFWSPEYINVNGNYFKLGGKIVPDKGQYFGLETESFLTLSEGKTPRPAPDKGTYIAIVAACVAVLLPVAVIFKRKKDKAAKVKNKNK